MFLFYCQLLLQNAVQKNKFLYSSIVVVRLLQKKLGNEHHNNKNRIRLQLNLMKNEFPIIFLCHPIHPKGTEYRLVRHYYI